MKFAASWVFLLAIVASPAFAERARNAADATVFIRVSVTLQAEVVDGPGLRRRVDTELYRMSGSGFVISNYGHVLTNAHVVTPALEEVALTQSGAKITGTLSVTRIDVCFPRESAVWDDLVAQPGLDQSKCLDAAIVARDEVLDLAVLSVSASNLRYLGLGDSDAVVAGQMEEALGFPLGAKLEIGRDNPSGDVVPGITQTSGTVSALRMGCGTGATRGTCVSAADRESQRRFLQISNAINPGNSGGPVVDRHGFAIGVVQSKIVDKDNPVEGLGFAIPINVAKTFLEERGLDAVLPVRRVRPGPIQALESKRLRIALPEGFVDTAPFASRVETESQETAISFRVDRVLSPWTSQRVEEELIGTPIFERGSWASHETRTPNGRVPVRTGMAFGEFAAGGDDVWMLYGIADLGGEKLVARYTGAAERLAFSESILLNSLASIEGQRFPAPDIASIDRLRWSSSTDAQGQPAVPIPLGWTIMADGPTKCSALPPASTAGSATSADDYTVFLRAAVWAERQLDPVAAAASCGDLRGAQSASSYRTQFDYLGVRYAVDGVLVRPSAERLVQLEVVAPEARGAFARALLAAWIKRIVP